LYLISIIIPVFNAEDYIVSSLQSVLKGITEEIEVIIINDGSNDKSVSLIKLHFGEQILSKQFKLIEQQNAGVSVARNVGISSSEGKYIAFVDADDLLINNYFEQVLPIINEKSPDIIEFGYRRFSDEIDIVTNRDGFTHKAFGELKTQDVIDGIFAVSIFYTPLRIIKKSVVADLNFPVGVKFCEDMIFLYQLYQKSESIYHIDKALYAYRDNSNGATRNMKPEYIDAMLQLYQNLLEDKRPEISYLKVSVFYVIWRCNKELGQSIRLPFNIFMDSKKLTIQFLFDSKISMMKKLILAMPNLYRILANLKSKYGVKK